MPRYSVAFQIDASVSVVVDAETEEEARDKADNLVSLPSICHHCARVIDIGDIVQTLNVTEVPDSTPLTRE